MIFAQTYEELMKQGQFYETLGWVFGGLGFAVIIAGVVYSIWSNQKKSRRTDRQRS